MTHKFVEHIPEKLEDDIIYVSIPFETVIHKCACGCGSEVVTPLSPAEWNITFNGETISLHPSIGSWSLDCKSHYWIRNNRVEWSSKWSMEEIEKVKHEDFIAKKEYYQDGKKKSKEIKNDVLDPKTIGNKRSFWKVILSLFKT